MGQGEGRRDRLVAAPADDGRTDVGWTDDGPVLGGRHRARGVPLLTVPTSLRSARLEVAPSAVLGLVVLVVVVGAVVGVRVAWAERAAEPTPVAEATSGAGAPAAADPTPAADPTAAAEPVAGPAEPADGRLADPGARTTAGEPAALVVHVIGAVRSPGVVSLPMGSRVHDAVDAAGGVRDDADVSRVNLARGLADGERVWVPVTGEDPPADLGPRSEDGGAGPAGPAGEGDGTASSPGGAVDLNTADQALLETLPGVGPVTAQRILQWRADHGRFSSAEELLEVSGIGPKTLEQLRPHLAVGG